MMKIAGTVFGAVGVLLSSVVLHGQELSRYRTFELGSSVAVVVTETGASETQVRKVHATSQVTSPDIGERCYWTMDV